MSRILELVSSSFLPAKMLKKLNESMILAGEPVPFDCYDSVGKLLLRKGVVVEFQNQMDALLERGLYVEEEPPAAARVAGPMKIVIVDDNLSMRKVLTALFQSQGHLVVASLEDGSGLAQCINEFSPDLICLDQNMPGKSGLELLIELQSASPEIDVVMMTGSSDPELAGKAANAGASGFILKPFSPAQILEEIRNIVETRQIVAVSAAKDPLLDLRVPGVSKGTVLIVDDSSVVRVLLKGILEEIGLKVLPMAGNGADGVEAARKYRPELVCLDVEMPRMSGLDALPLIMQASPKSKVVMITGSPDKGFAERATAGGARGYILKPVRPAYVEAFMKKLLV